MDIAGQANQIMQTLLPGHLGIKIETATREEVVGSMTVTEMLCTTGGILHGGAMMALADTLGALVAFLNLPSGARTSTVESKTNFLRPAATGTKVTACCKIANKGRTLILLVTELRDDRDRLLAMTSQSQIIIRE